MTRTRYNFLPDDPCPYIITTTTVNWLPLFGNPAIAQIILDSLNFLIMHQRIEIFAYVIMENHVHLVACADDLAKEIGDFKSFTARKSIDYYLQYNVQFALEQLATNKLSHKRDREFQFWQEGSHPQRINSREMMAQKIEYIHNNPVRRGYTDRAEDWRYSSARDYAGLKGLVPVVIDW